MSWVLRGCWQLTPWKENPDELHILVAEESLVHGVYFIPSLNDEAPLYMKSRVVGGDQHQVHFTGPPDDAVEIKTLYTRKFHSDMYFIQRCCGDPTISWLAENFEISSLPQTKIDAIATCRKIPKYVKDLLLHS